MFPNTSAILCHGKPMGRQPTRPKAPLPRECDEAPLEVDDHQPGPGGRDPNFLDASKAQGKIDRVMNDPQHKYWKGDKQSVFEVSLLFALVGRQQ